MPRAFRAPAQTPQRAPGRGLRTWGAAGLPGEKADTKAKGGGGHSVRGTGGGGDTRPAARPRAPRGPSGATGQRGEGISAPPPRSPGGGARVGRGRRGASECGAAERPAWPARRSGQGRGPPGEARGLASFRPAPGGCPSARRRLPELSASGGGADARGGPTACRQGPLVCHRTPNVHRTSWGPCPGSGQRGAARGGGVSGAPGRSAHRLPPRPSRPACRCGRGPGIAHSWATAAWRPGCHPSGPPRLAPAPGHAAPLRTCCARPLPFFRPPRPP